MREIKPSVLSTIMNYLYDQEEGEDNDLYRSLRGKYFKYFFRFTIINI